MLGIYYTIIRESFGGNWSVEEEGFKLYVIVSVLILFIANTLVASKGNSTGINLRQSNSERKRAL